jgi:2-aminoadipate transaminase
MESALKMMKEYFPKEVSWVRPSGGYTIWVRMPRALTSAELNQAMSENGVLVSSGAPYFLQRNRSEYFRLSIARVGEDQMKEGLLRLGKALRCLSARA